MIDIALVREGAIFVRTNQDRTMDQCSGHTSAQMRFIRAHLGTQPPLTRGSGLLPGRNFPLASSSPSKLNSTQSVALLRPYDDRTSSSHLLECIVHLQKYRVGNHVFDAEKRLAMTHIRLFAVMSAVAL